MIKIYRSASTYSNVPLEFRITNISPAPSVPSTTSQKARRFPTTLPNRTTTTTITITRMDTTAYLQTQGWLGAGHALQTRGLSKPLLVSQKQNVLGVGKKRHDAHADQWWARAFDGCLKGLEVSRVADGKQGVEEGGEKGEKAGEVGVRVRVEGRGGGLDALRIAARGGKVGGLYGFFVRGEGLRGTFLGADEGVDEGLVVEEVAVPREGAVGVETRIGRKRMGVAGGAERVERKRRRRERKEREAVGSVDVVEEEDEVPDGELKILRKEERRKRRRDRDAAEDGTVTANSIAETTQDNLSSSLRKKKRRRVEVSDDDGSRDLVTAEERVASETSLTEGCETKATDEVVQDARKEKLERRRRRAGRKTLKAEQSRSADDAAGRETEEKRKSSKTKKNKSRS